MTSWCPHGATLYSIFLSHVLYHKHGGHAHLQRQGDCFLSARYFLSAERRRRAKSNINCSTVRYFEKLYSEVTQKTPYTKRFHIMTEEDQIQAAIVLSLKDKAPKADTKYNPRVFNTLKRTGQLNQYREYQKTHKNVRGADNQLCHKISYEEAEYIKSKSRYSTDKTEYEDYCTDFIDHQKNLRWEKKRTNTFVTKGDDDPDTTGQHRIIDRDFIQTAKNYDESKGTDYENYKFRSFSMDLYKNRWEQKVLSAKSSGGINDKDTYTYLYDVGKCYGFDLRKMNGSVHFGKYTHSSKTKVEEQIAEIRPRKHREYAQGKVGGRKGVILKKDGTPDRRRKGQKDMHAKAQVETDHKLARQLEAEWQGAILKKDGTPDRRRKGQRGMHAKAQVETDHKLARQLEAEWQGAILKKDGTPDRRRKGQRDMYADARGVGSVVLKGDGTPDRRVKGQREMYSLDHVMPVYPHGVVLKRDGTPDRRVSGQRDMHFLNYGAPAYPDNIVLKGDGTPDRRVRGQREMYAPSGDGYFGRHIGGHVGGVAIDLGMGGGGGGPRCADGSLDMRFAVNRGHSKY